MSLPTFSDYLIKISSGQRLTETEALNAFESIMQGSVPASQIAGFLIGLRVMGETAIEISGAAKAMRRHAVSVNVPKGAIDIVGTGGDQSHSLNISTATSLLTAACGVPVAKHGNRAVTSNVGASDALQALGLNLNAPVKDVEAMFRTHGYAFLLAPMYHPAMRHVADVRSTLAVPTLFNVLGPLVNPASVKHALIGCYDINLMPAMAESLSGMSMDKVWLVHGGNGLDELTTFGMNTVIEIQASETRTFRFSGDELGFTTPAISDGQRIPSSLAGRDAAYNADCIRNLFTGVRNVFRDHVVLNTGAALHIAGHCNDLKAGLVRASAVLDSGEAQSWLVRLLDFKIS